MHPAIMDLNNALTYQGALRCGNQQVQSSLLDLPLRDASNVSSIKPRAVAPILYISLHMGHSVTANLQRLLLQ